MLHRDHVRKFLPGLYPVGALLALAPLADVIGAAWPFRLLDPAWRFGVIGLEFRAVLVQVAGIALLMTVAAILGHRSMMRLMAGVSVVAAVALSAGVTRFILDYRILGEAVGARTGFDVSAFRAVLAAILSVPVLTALGGRGWTAAVGAPPVEPEVKPDDQPQVIPFRGRASFGRRLPR